LIGASGPPTGDWSVVVGDQPDISGMGSDEDKPFSVSTKELCLIELAREVRWASWQLEAELSLDEAEQCEAGVYFARQAVETANGVQQGLSRFIASEHGRVRWDLVRYQSEPKPGLSPVWSAPAHLFLPTQAEKGKERWRKLVVQVTAEEAQAFWHADPAGAADRIGKATLTVLAENAKTGIPGARSGPWTFSPQAGLGLYVHKGGASFRNVTVERLP
jgi:hypothetical protein